MGEQMIDMAAPIRLWPVKGLREHPDNPRAVNIRSEKFRDLVASIEGNGIVEPLTVRSDPGLDSTLREVLSGHRRLAAARELGLKEVPVRDLGDVSDGLAYDIVAMANLHEDLTPLEEGKRAAVWLDKYNQDVAAVAAKLGKSPSWVVQHAQIFRGLSAEWRKAATDMVMLDRWTAGHWAVIARLPVGLQAHELAKFRNGAYCSYDRWTIAELESRIKIESLFLVKAPFEVALCDNCIDRTDRQPLLWGETADAATGDKARCLNKKCYEKRVLAHAKKELKEAAVEKGVPDAVPLSLLERPTGWAESARYDERMRELKKQYGPKLLTADKVEVVPEGTKGAVPAIAVAGVRGKGAMGVRWVKLVETKDSSGVTRLRPPSAAQLAKEAQETRERERWDAVAGRVYEAIQASPRPGLPVLALLTSLVDADFNLSATERLAEGSLRYVKVSEKSAKEFEDWVADLLWTDLKDEFEPDVYHSWERDDLVPLGRLFGIDVQAIYDEIVAAEEPAEAASDESRATGDGEKEPRKPRASGSARRKKAKKAKKSEE